MENHVYFGLKSLIHTYSLLKYLGKCQVLAPSYNMHVLHSCITPVTTEFIKMLLISIILQEM